MRVSDLILSPMVNAGEAPRPIPSSVLYSETIAAVLELAGAIRSDWRDSRVSVQIAESENGAGARDRSRPVHSARDRAA